MPDVPRWCKKDMLTLALLIVGVSFFHARGLWPGQAFLPIDLLNNNLPWRTGPFDMSKLQNPTIGDPIYAYYPYLVHAVNEFKRGTWLLWDSGALLGHPSLGDPAYQTFYPVLSILGLALGPARGLTIGLWLHVLLAAIFTYGWLRTQNYTWSAALGALVYALSGYMVTWFETGFFTTTLSWLPGVLWMFELALRRRHLGYTALAALMFGLAVLAGQVSFAVIFALFLGAYALGRTIEYSQPKRLFLWPLGAVALTIGLGTLLGTIQILPFAEALSHSHRSGGVAFAPFPWQQLVTLIVPNWYGNPSTPFAYWGAENYNEATFYAGLITLLLALMALFSARRFWMIYIGLLGIGLVYYSCGGPGIAWINRLPVLQYVTLNRSMALLSLPLALLAASTLHQEHLSRGGLFAATLVIAAIVAGTAYFNRDQIPGHLESMQPLMVQAAVMLGLIIGILTSRERWPRFREALDLSLVVLTFIDLYLWGARYNPASPIDQFPPATPAIEYLQTHAGRDRVMTKQESGEFVFGPQVLSIYGVPDLSFYSSLEPPQLRKLIIVGDPGSQGYHRNVIVFGHPTVRLTDLLQTRYVVSQGPLPDPGVRPELALGACASQGDEIRQDYSAHGMFVVRDSAINRLDLTFRVDTPDHPDSAFTVRLWQGQSRERLVLESSFRRSQIQNEQPLTFFFAPEQNARGLPYVWQVSTDAARTGVSMCARADGTADLGVYGADWMPVYSGELHIAERTLPPPRAYIVYATETIPDEEQAIQRLLDETFDLRNVAITSEPPGLPLADERPSTPAVILVYENRRIVIQANTTQPGLLVLGDSFYPAWDVLVDRQPAKLVRANLIWRGVALSPGNHVVEFHFFPKSLQAGLWLGGLGILGMIGLCLLQSKCRRR